MWKSKKIHYTWLWCPARNQTHNLIHPEFTEEQQQGQNTPGLNNLHLGRTQTGSEAGLWFLPLLEQGHRLKLRLDSTRLTPISTLAWESWRFYLFANSNCMNHILLKRVNFLFLIFAFISAHTHNILTLSWGELRCHTQWLLCDIDLASTFYCQLLYPYPCHSSSQAPKNNALGQTILTSSFQYSLEALKPQRFQPLFQLFLTPDT